MKSVILIIGFLTLAACTKSENKQHPNNPLNLAPQGGDETKKVSLKTESLNNDELQPALDLGKRAIEWLNLVNEKRDTQNRLNLADRMTKNPVPPEKPKVNSTALILERLKIRTSEIPAAMKPYLLEQKDLTDVLPVSDEEFIQSIRGLNGVYQSAVRWIGQRPYLDYYSQNDVYDIRGVYFFKKEIDLENKLNHFSQLDAATQTNYSEWLISLCHNSEVDQSLCRQELDQAQNDLKNPEAVRQFYSKYLQPAENVYNHFFEVENIRTDLLWNADRSIITQDFTNPEIEKIATWFKVNVEEEWQFKGFQLIIQFVQKNEVSPFLEFVKGVTPHVSGETHNKITMDPDYSLDDYDTQWTIRHEFGHVLGFPDCYLEFYDSEKMEMTYYTIEPDNLMCAWGGKLQQSHADELKRVY